MLLVIISETAETAILQRTGRTVFATKLALHRVWVADVVVSEILASTQTNVEHVYFRGGPLRFFGRSIVH